MSAGVETSSAEMLGYGTSLVRRQDGDLVVPCVGDPGFRRADRLVVLFQIANGGFAAEA